MLCQDESLLWIGQPVPGEMIEKSKTTISICAICTLTMALLAAPLFFSSLPKDEEVMCKAILIVAVLVPALVTVLIPVFVRIKAEETVYVITNRRALIIEPNRLYEFNVLDTLDIREDKNGISDLIFERMELQVENNTIRKPIGFRCVTSSDLIEEILQRVFEPNRVRHWPPRESDTWVPKG